MKKKYGLALGGGAAKGICHVGVIESLLENKVSIQEISGTSMGAIIGSAFAFGMSPKEIKMILSDINYVSLIDLNLKNAIISGDKISKKLESIFSGALIEEAKIPLKIVTTQIEGGSLVVFQQGKVSDCLRASISLPSIFTPYAIHGRKYIDGGLAQNLPVLVLESKSIIAVSAIQDLSTWVNSKKHKFLGFNLPESLLSQNYHLYKRFISIGLKLNEDLSIECARAKGKNITLLSPSTHAYEYHDFHAYEDLIRVGYESAQAVFSGKKL